MSTEIFCWQEIRCHVAGLVKESLINLEKKKYIVADQKSTERITYKPWIYLNTQEQKQ